MGIFVFLGVLLVLEGSFAKFVPRCGCQSCHPLKKDLINVHIVPHTHDDVGWLKTIDQYFYGSKPNVQKAAVENILDSVVEELQKNPDRRFIYVETAFFWKWWIKQHDKVRYAVKRLVRNGQLEFIGGAWSMNDEAATHYHSIVDQFTWGLRKLNDSFGSCGRPKIGWQIDPFGHSREMASLFAQMGYHGLLLGRIDFQDKRFRFGTKTAEMIWSGSDSLGDKADLFTGVMFNTYSPPPGFCFDVFCDDEPIVDNPKSPDYNVPSRVKDLFAYLKNVSEVYETNNIIITMGNDFNYQDAHVWFKNLDKLIYYSNLEQANGSKYNLIYSTPSCYVKAVHDAAQETDTKFPVKTDDFFPYASDPHAFWSGYFTSRPTLKRFEREGNNFLQICKQLYSLTDLGPEDWADLNALREAMGVMQHHDAITGTEKQHVAFDYARILSRGVSECEFTAATALSKIVTGNNTRDFTGDPKPSIPFQICPLLNVSSCPFTEERESFVVTVYNPLSRNVSTYVRVPVSGTAYSVRDPDGQEITVQLNQVPQTVIRIPGRESSATVELTFIASDLPPLGFKSYYIQRTNGNDVVTPTVVSVDEASTVTITGKSTSVQVDAKSGLLTSVTMNGVTIPVTQNFLFYRGAVGDNKVSANRSSGAYIFRPNGTDAYNLTSDVKLEQHAGELVEEVRQVFNEWISQIIRVYKEEDVVEFDWIVGPIPEDDVNGKEIISRFTTNLLTGSTFYTDSNGRETLQRIRNFRPTWKVNLKETIAGNYYPVTTKIMMRDEGAGLELAVLTDRAQGGSSLRDGELELMVHRRCLRDDGFGVEEALNETAFDEGLVVRGSHYLVMGQYKNISAEKSEGKSVAFQERDLVQKKLLSAWTFVSPTENLSFKDYKATHKMQYSGLRRNLPGNVQILTLEPWQGMNFLLRLEHVFEKNADQTFSQPATVDLKGIFTAFEILSIRETSLAANEWLDENEEALKFDKGVDLEDVVEAYTTGYANYQREWLDKSFVKNLIKWRSRYSHTNEVEFKHDKSGEAASDDPFKILLQPMQIRTFVVDVKKKL